MRSTASPAQTGCGGRSPCATPSRYACLAPALAASSPSRPRHSSRNGWPRVRPGYLAGHREPRAMSSTRLRSVSSPCPSTIAFLISGLARDSAVAWNRVPMSAPAAPRARAAATPRPSAIPPAARTGVGAARSTTTGTKGSVDRPRRAPCPPASVPWATMTSAPSVHGLPGLLKVGDLDDQRRTRLPDESGERAGVAEGQHHGPGPVLQRTLDRAGVDRPALETDPPGLAGALGDDRQLTVQPVQVPVTPAEQAQPAAVRDRRRQRTARRSAHRGQRDGVPQREHRRERGRQRHSAIITPPAGPRQHQDGAAAPGGDAR